MWFAIEDGEAVVRIDANPSDERLPDGGLPACNGGFACRALLAEAEFARRHPA